MYLGFTAHPDTFDKLAEAEAEFGTFQPFYTVTNGWWDKFMLYRPGFAVLATIPSDTFTAGSVLAVFPNAIEVPVLPQIVDRFGHHLTFVNAAGAYESAKAFAAVHGRPSRALTHSFAGPSAHIDLFFDGTVITADFDADSLTAGVVLADFPEAVPFVCSMIWDV